MLLAYFVPARDEAQQPPFRQLFAFGRARAIAPGAAVEVPLYLDEAARTLYSTNGAPYVPNGGHSVMIGEGVQALVSPLLLHS